MATEEAKMSEEAQEVQRRINRDLNCLSDENRGTRRGALNKLNRVFFGKRVEPPPDAVCRELFYACLATPLLERFDDPIEKCREMAIQLILNFREKLGDSVDWTPLMDVGIPTIAQRLGTHPFPEVAEELRVLLLQLLRVFIETPSSAKHLRRHVSDVVQVLVKASGDKFQETKKQAASCCIALCKSAPDVVHLQLEQLVNSQVGNLTHHHKAVRKEALLALCELMLHGSDGVEKLMNGTVLPALKARVHDRNGPVRKTLLRVVARWLVELPDRRPYEARLAALLLAGMSDYAPEIQKLALTKLESVGSKVLKKAREAAAAAAAADADGSASDVPMNPVLAAEAAAAAGDEDVNMAGGAGAGAGAGDMAQPGGSGDGSVQVDSGVADSDWRGTDVMPEVFNGRRAKRGARILVRRLLPKILPHVLADANEWVADTRANAAGLVVTLFAVAEDAVTGHIDTVLASLVRGTSDDDARVRKSTSEAAAVVGRFVDPDAQLAVLLPQARGEVSGLGTPEYRSATLEVLSGVITGMTCEQLAPHLLAIARTIVDPSMAEGEPRSLRIRLAAVVNNLLGTARDALRGNNDICRVLLRVTLHAMARGADEDVDELAVSCLQRLAEVTASGSVGGLFAKFARGLLTDICDDAGEWTKNSFNRCVFDVAVRQGGAALHGGADKLVEVLWTTLNPGKQPDLRLAQLALVKVLLGSVVGGEEGNEEAKASAGEGTARAAMDEKLKQHAGVMLEHVLLPNMVWRVGGVAATIRKVAVYCFYTLFKRKLVSPDVLRSLYSQLAAPIKTCLGDEDSVTRKWSCLLMRYAYVLLAGKCTHDEVSDIYHDLVKRLDDSNNEVRKHVCDTLVEFVNVGPREAYTGTPMEYTVDCMLIHLDDPNTDVQAAVCRALGAWARLDARFVLPRIQAVRSRHRTPVYCDELIAMLTPLAA